MNAESRWLLSLRIFAAGKLETPPAAICSRSWTSSTARKRTSSRHSCQSPNCTLSSRTRPSPTLPLIGCHARHHHTLQLYRQVRGAGFGQHPGYRYIPANEKRRSRVLHPVAKSLIKAKFPCKILKSHKDTPLGPNVHNDKLEIHCKIKVFGIEQTDITQFSKIMDRFIRNVSTY